MVKWFDIHAVHTADNGGEGLSSRTQQVYIRIVFSLAEGGSADIKIDLLCFFVTAAVFNDLCPNHFQAAQFGDLHKEIGADAEMETQMAAEGVDVDAAAFHSAHIGYCFVHGVGYFLNVVSAAVVINIGIDYYCSQLRSNFFSPGNAVCHFVIIFVQWTN